MTEAPNQARREKQAYQVHVSAEQHSAAGCIGP